LLVAKIDARPVVLTMASMAMLMARQRVKMRIDEFAADAVLRNDANQEHHARGDDTRECVRRGDHGYRKHL
jgi:hypothetical protein